MFDLRGIVVDGVAKDPKVLVNLFERCGEQDLRFVVNSGLVLGTRACRCCETETELRSCSCAPGRFALILLPSGVFRVHVWDACRCCAQVVCSALVRCSYGLCGRRGGRLR